MLINQGECMQEITCIFCNTHNNSVVIKENGYTGKQCSSCSLVYISPRPHFENIVTIYSHDDAHISASAHISGNLLKRLYARHTLNIIKRYRTSGELLEIGSGGGYFLDEARAKGFKSHGLELNPMQAEFITNKLHIPCETTLLSPQSFGSTTFDLIYHSDVISHFYDPIQEFRTMYSKLNAGGLLVFETGNIGDIDTRYYKEFTRFQYPDHLFFFSEKNLEHLLTMTGFKLVKIYRYSIVPHLKIMKLITWLQGNKEKKSNETFFAQPTQATFKSKLKNLLKMIYYYTLYIVRYKIGALLPKKGRPLTVIVVAQKM